MSRIGPEGDVSREGLVVEKPQHFPECSSCGYAERTVVRATTFFVHEREGIDLECVESGGGGSRQVEPGVWVEHRDRRISIVPRTPREDGSSSRLEGVIFECPHDIPGTDKEREDIPRWEIVSRDPYGRTFRNKLRKPGS